MQLPVDARRTQIFDKLIQLQRKLLHLLGDVCFHTFSKLIITISFCFCVLLSSAAFTVNVTSSDKFWKIDNLNKFAQKSLVSSMLWGLSPERQFKRQIAFHEPLPLFRSARTS